jgi:hypothetical protein
MRSLYEELIARPSWTLITSTDWLGVNEEIARWDRNCPGWTGPRVALVPVAGHPTARGLVALEPTADAGSWLGVLLPPTED